jgi:WD40 repeat protein
MLTSLLLLASTAELAAQELKERASFKEYKFWVNCATLSPDGKIVAAGGGDLRLWDATSGKEIAALGDQIDLRSLTFSRDGRWLASVSRELIQVWDVSTRKEIAAFKDVRGGENHVLAFSPDGKRLAANVGRQVKLWDVSSGKELAAFHHHEYRTRGLAFSPDLRTLATGNYQEIDLWNMATGKERGILSEHRGQVDCLAYSADGETLIATSTRYYGWHAKWQGDVKLWDLATGRDRASFDKGVGRVTAVMLSPDGKTLALLDSPESGIEANVKLMDVATGRQRVISVPPLSFFLSLQFTTTGKLYASGISNKFLKLWEVLPSKVAAE